MERSWDTWEHCRGDTGTAVDPQVTPCAQQRGLSGITGQTGGTVPPPAGPVGFPSGGGGWLWTVPGSDLGGTVGEVMAEGTIWVLGWGHPWGSQCPA